MFKNYLKTAFRSLWRNKATSFINLFGLSIGMTAAVFIFLWVQNETSFDQYHPGKENIFRITNTMQVSDNESWTWESSPMLMAETVLQQVPEVKQAARMTLDTWTMPVLNVHDRIFSERTVAHIDKSWFNIFHYHFLQGSAEAFDSSPFSVIVTESKAKKYFGSLDAIGQVIMIDSTNYTVQGVVADNPANSTFQSDILLNVAGRLSAPETYKNDKNWNNFGYITFVALQPGTSTSLIEKKLNAVLNKNRSRNNTTVSVTPLAEMHFETNLQSSELPHGNKKTTYIFALLGVLLLLTACINYVNLTTAKAGLRVKEVSIRKIVGAQYRSLFTQFVVESFLISGLALCITLLLIQLLLPAFNVLTEKQFRLPLTSAAMWQVLLGTLAIAVLLNGIYPALLLSSFQPLNVFRGVGMLKLRDGAVRKGLVVFQFALSMLLIAGVLVIYRQLHFIQTTNPGYRVAQVMSLQIPYHRIAAMQREEVTSFYDGIRHDLEAQSSVAAVSSGSDEIVDIGSKSSGNADWDGRDTSFNPTIAQLSADTAFRSLFDLHMLQGRWFEKGTTDQHNYILNETAVRELNIHKPVVGQRFTWGGDTGQVIGVVKDFYFRSLHEKIGAMVIRSRDKGNPYLFVKVAPGKLQKAIADAGKIWLQYLPGQPFEYKFLDDRFNRLYTADIQTGRLILIFSIVAMIVSALGLFGLAAFTAERRTKEIGIRKVLGAGMGSIVHLLSRDFIKLVLVAIGIATPVAWFAAHQWLQDFAYRIPLHAGLFVAAGSLAILVAILSVSMQAIKAAIANPVKSLRTE